MAHHSFVPGTFPKRVGWLQNIGGKIANYAKKYNLTDDQVADLMAGAAFMLAWAQYDTAVRAYSKQVTTFSGEEMNGVKPGATASVMPAPPTPPTLVVPSPGILARASAIGLGIKKSYVYTEADGEDLLLIGSDEEIDDNSLQPVLDYRFVNGGQPEILWNKMLQDGIEIWKDSGDGNWVMLAYAQHPNTIDNTPLGGITGAAVWRYKAIYRNHDHEVGQWSQVMSVTVTGTGGIVPPVVTVG